MAEKLVNKAGLEEFATKVKEKTVFIGETLGTSTNFLDLFYPVGTYYETSNTSFDPNTAWGGTWVEDSEGRVLVAKNTGTFSTVGDTGGEETNIHQHWQTNGADARLSYDLSADDTISVSGINTRVIHNVNRISNTQNNAGKTDTRQHTTYNEEINILQPYIVVKRWHRTA